jgi:hypothetical protein
MPASAISIAMVNACSIASGPLEPALECVPVKVLHHHEHRPGVLADVVKRADVWMRQTRHRLRLALGARAVCGVGRNVSGQDFDRNGAIKPCIAGLTVK